jgi:hypothetical protein
MRGDRAAGQIVIPAPKVASREDDDLWFGAGSCSARRR